MNAVASVLLAAGASLTVIALALGAALFRPGSWLFSAPLALGLLLGLLGAMLRFRTRTNALRSGRLAAELVGIAVLVVLVQFVAVKTTALVDLSSTRRNTLSEKSLAVARGLAIPVAIEAAMGRDDRAFVELSAIVERYRAVTDRIQLFRTDERPGLGEPNAAAVRAVEGGVRRAPMRIVAGAPDHEELITNALVALTAQTAVRAYFVSGHGERELVDDSPAGLSRLRDALAIEGFEAVPLPLSLVPRVPLDAAVVVVTGPTGALPDDDREKLQAYLDAGGRALLLVEPAAADGIDSGLDSVVGAFGIHVAQGVVVDDSALSGLVGGPETATGSQLEHQHPVTRPLGEALTHFPRARPLADSPGTQAKVTPLVLTGTEAYAELDADGARVRDADETGGPLALVMASEDTLPLTLDGKPRHARLVVVGDATCAENRGIGLGANKDLLVNALLWLAEREDKIAIRPVGRGGSLLLLTPTGRERLVFVLLYGVPVLLVVVGVGIKARRRR